MIDRAHKFCILDTRMSQVKFTEGAITELTTNIIAESMYTQCNADGKEHILLDDKSIFLEQKQTRISGRPVTCKTTAGWKIYCQ